MTNDPTATIQDCKKLVAKFCRKRDWTQFHNPKDLAIGISTEANELLQIFRFKTEDEIKLILAGERRTEVEDELADVFYFVLRFADVNNIDLYSAVYNKLEKNNKKYPVEKSKGSNKKYTEF